jgi:N-acetylmuramoyl-L-alanine amidase
MINGLFTFVILLFCASSALAGKYTTVIIDPGHGGKDRGAKWGGISEAYLNLKVAKKVEALLKAKKIPVRLTRTSDVYLSLSKRAAIANKYKDAIFVSIHFNAHTNTSYKGVETFYASEKGKKIASSIQSRISRHTKTRNRGIKLGASFAVLNKTKCPAVLVECGFISNPYERRRCSQSWYQDLAARGIVEGIIKTR